jgi:hypothetical protein
MRVNSENNDTTTEEGEEEEYRYSFISGSMKKNHKALHLEKSNLSLAFFE